MFYGWDISTSIVGASVFDGCGTYVTSSYCDLRKVDSLNEKADACEQFLRRVLTYDVSGSSDVHFIEDRLMSFSLGATSKNTLMKLASFNAIVSFLIHRNAFNGSTIVMLHPSKVKATMRKLGLIINKGDDKKQMTLEFVMSRERDFKPSYNRNGKPNPWCYDMADSFITALAGIVLERAALTKGQ